MKSTYNLITAALLLAAPSAFANNSSNNQTESRVEHIEVTGSLKGLSINQMPASVSIVDAASIATEQGAHLQDILNNFANINFAGGTSRPRYFQIRGVGETDSYAGAPNSSVGFIIDDIDLSGIGGVSSLYDVGQVEVLRGPQGTRFGANALGGMIYTQSKAPTAQREHGIQVKARNDSYQTVSAYTSGAATEKLNYRLSVNSHYQDGYITNSYLKRNDTNKRDELTLRGKFNYQVSDNTQIDLALLKLKFNNGYDAWTLDNNGKDTRSDMPGVDTQDTTGASLKVTSEFDNVVLTAITSGSDTDTRYAYDQDWANPTDWAAKDCGGNPCVYHSTADKQANRKVLSQELRLGSTDASRLFGGSTEWVVGAFVQQFEEESTYEEPYHEYMWEQSKYNQSSYSALSYSLFGQLDTNFSNGYSLSAGLRLERRDAKFLQERQKSYFGEVDLGSVASEDIRPSDNMWGGHLSLSKAFTDNQNGYVRLSKGYKAGGFNVGLGDELADKREYQPESLYNLETGLKSNWLANRAYTQVSLFAMVRDDQQVDSSFQAVGGGPFTNYITNATSSTSYGFEFEGNVDVTENLNLYGSLGLLDATYDSYAYEDEDGNQIDRTGRQLAHAPDTTFSLGASYYFDNGLFVNVNGNGKSEFFYSDSHNQKSKGYTLVNAQMGYKTDEWSLTLWAKNLTDERYGTRGFYFGNDPSDGWTPHQYIRYGDPRQIGVTFSYDL